MPSPTPPAPLRLPYVRLRQLDELARSRWTYKHDFPKDTWRSYADQVLAGLPWQGDCDDLSATVLDLATRQGQNPADCAYLMVDSTGGNKIDHMVGLATSQEGNQYVVGDTFGSIYSVGRMRHKPIQMSPWTATIWYQAHWLSSKKTLVTGAKVN